MPISQHRPHYNISLAASIAAHNQFLNVAAHRPDGVVLPDPIPALSPRQRVDARAFAIELFERRLCDLLSNPVPEEVRHAG